MTFVDFSRFDSGTGKMVISYGEERTLEIPGEQFSGLLLYPSMSILESSLYYEQ